MEQVIPGADPEGWSDPISDSNDRKEVGDYSGAYDILMDLCRADLRCLDAHSHLGNLSFDMRPKDAIRHYEVGVRIGELSLPAGFNGALPWRLLDNRPFLRCLQGYGLCLWRLKRFDESAAVFDRMLWLNPSDNQGIRFIIDEVRARRLWRPE
jgi:tetratricopeptide (TPR) repeat protein